MSSLGNSDLGLGDAPAHRGDPAVAEVGVPGLPQQRREGGGGETQRPHPAAQHRGPRQLHQHQVVHGEAAGGGGVVGVDPHLGHGDVLGTTGAGSNSTRFQFYNLLPDVGPHKTFVPPSPGSPHPCW